LLFLLNAVCFVEKQQIQILRLQPVWTTNWKPLCLQYHLVYTVNAICRFLFQKGILVYVNHRWLPEDTKGIIRISQLKDRQHNGKCYLNSPLQNIICDQKWAFLSQIFSTLLEHPNSPGF
jgi:hypothetical protein